MSTWQDTKGFPGCLSQRQWDSVSRQAKAALDSWLTNRQNEFRNIVYASTLSDDAKRELYGINLRYAWYERVDDEAHHMARRLMKRLRKRHRMPDLSKCRVMDMDGKIARMEDARNAKCERWAVVSTLESSRPIRVPIVADRRLDENLFLNDETLSNHLTIRFDLEGNPSGKADNHPAQGGDTHARRDVGPGLGHGPYARPIRRAAAGRPNVRMVETTRPGTCELTRSL